jgi:hypothetical protein
MMKSFFCNLNVYCGFTNNKSQITILSYYQGSLLPCLSSLSILAVT